MIGLILLALLQVGDWLTTRTVLKRGGQELNPVIRSLLDLLGIDPALILKGILVVLIAYLTGPIVVWIGVVLYTAVVGWNIYQL